MLIHFFENPGRFIVLLDCKYLARDFGAPDRKD